MAFLIAPLVIPVGLSVAAVIFPGGSPVSLDQFLGLLVLFSLYALPPAYFVELALGLPAWLFFRRRGIRGWFAFATGGAALGTIYWLVYSLAQNLAAKTMAYDFVRHRLTRDINPLSLWFAVLAGLVSAISFRAIVFPKRNAGTAKVAHS